MTMTIKGLLLRFLLAYAGLMLAAGAVMTALDIQPNSGVGVGILAGCVIWVCMAFGQKNGRYFSAAEKSQAIGGMLGISLLLQLLALVALSDAWQPMSLWMLAVIAVLAGLLHLAGIYFFVSTAQKILAKQNITSPS